MDLVNAEIVIRMLAKQSQDRQDEALAELKSLRNRLNMLIADAEDGKFHTLQTDYPEKRIRAVMAKDAYLQIRFALGIPVKDKGLL